VYTHCAICWETIILHSHPEIEISFKFIPKTLISKECTHFFGPLCIWSTTYLYRIESSLNGTYKILTQDRCSMTTLPPVITQQYSSTTFLSTQCNSGKEKFGACRKMKFSFLNIFLFFFKFETASLTIALIWKYLQPFVTASDYVQFSSNSPLKICLFNHQQIWLCTVFWRRVT
jgi:hypothetical protein